MEELQPGAWTIYHCTDSSARLDSFLAQKFSISRARVQKLVEEEFVRWNGKTAKSNQHLEPGDTIEIFLPPPKEIGLKPENIPIEVLFQDKDIAVIQKPAGLVVHPAAGNWDGTLVNALLHHFGEELSAGKGISGELRPGIVHRIDKNTSGILLITKSDLAHQSLSKQFKEHSISRKYIGLAWGKLPGQGEWNGSIARDPKERKRMALVPEGRSALTKYKTLKQFQGLSLFEAALFTGRTHQIRVHFASAGFPLVGDTIYQNATRKAKQAKEELRKLQKRTPELAEIINTFESRGRQFLHAAHLGFSHPVSGERLSFDSELPSDLSDLVLELEKWKK